MGVLIDREYNLEIASELSSDLEHLAHGSAQTFTAGLIILELLKLGIEEFIVSPGARAIPFVLALNMLEDSKSLGDRIPNVTLVNDERGACFLAQGMSKAGKYPCLICTSGTAVANYLPGVIEAYYSKVPLLIITTDRPWELQKAGANQTIDQGNIFTNFVARKLDVSAPENSIYVHSLLSGLDNLIYAGKKEQQPVHLNIAFRKPFYDAGYSPRLALSSAEQQLLNGWLSSKEPYLTNSLSSKSVRLSPFSQMQETERKTIFVLGPTRDEKLISSLLYASSELNIPIIADIHSNARHENYTNVFCYFNFYLESLKSLPDQIVLFGERFISDPLVRFVNSTGCSLLQVGDNVDRADAIENEFLNIRTRVSTDKFFSEYLPGLPHSPKSFLENFITLESETGQHLHTKLSMEDGSERNLIYRLPEIVSEDVNIFLSASLIFREADAYCSNFRKGVKLFGNRGATGIDGIIASAIGVGMGNPNPVLCVVGDQAALHDLNSFSLLSKLPQNIIILVVNNNGGAIFNLMRKAELRDVLINPHVTNFSKFAEGFGLDYFVSESVKEISSFISKGLSSNSRTKAIVEFKSDGVESAKYLYSL